MVYQILTVSLVLIEGVLIVIFWRYLKNIRLTSKDLITTMGKVKEDTLPMFQELKHLIEITSKRENHMLHTVFHLEEIEMHVKMIFNQLEQHNELKTSKAMNNLKN